MDINTINTSTLIPSISVERHYLQIHNNNLIISPQKTPILGFVFPDSFRHIIDPVLMRQLPQLFNTNKVTNIFVKNRFGMFNISKRLHTPKLTGKDIYFYYANTYTPVNQLERIRMVSNVAHKGNEFYNNNAHKYIIPDWYLLNTVSPNYNL